MSNRNKSGAPTPVRQPLLHVLQVEYERAAKAKNLPRMEEITGIVEALNRLWSDPVPSVAEQHSSAPPVIRNDLLLPEPAEWAPQQLPPLPEPPEPSDLPPVPFQLQDLLNSVPEGLWGDEERRADAKGRVKDAVLRVTHEVMAMQMRYELALQAHNRNHRALELFEPEAIILGISVADLAGRIINERRTAERRMQHVYTLLARISAEIDQATGNDIDSLTEAGIREIQALED
jgi:hypothetical protein